MLHVFGDSYSTPDYCVEKAHSWWGRLAQDMDTPVTNWSWPTNSVECIVHTLFCNQQRINQQDKIIIALPPIGRTVAYDEKTSTLEHAQIFNNDLDLQEHIPVDSHSGMINVSITDIGKYHLMGWNMSYNQAVTIRNMLLLCEYFTQDIAVVNASAPFLNDTQWTPLKAVLDKIQNRNNFNLQDTYYSVNKGKHKPVDFDQWEWQGHHGEAGNNEWYTQVIKPMTQNLGWQ